ncbi:MAG: family 1 glycosylhydrolase [Bdellovibrionota bacterium]
MKIWGGVECTVNRVGENFFDQCDKNGHKVRVEGAKGDLQRFADLGIKTLRYPILWENTAQKASDQYDWSTADQAMAEFQRLGLEPIVGLLHHGSGPLHTDLLDPEFPEKFAAYAKATATRYPWVTSYTPINEPLTTARFSGLYGIWYPHEKNDKAFVRCLFNEIKATILAMREIRKINPNAKLIQTDDLGRAQGTKKLWSQIKFENERRWLTFDLLFGWVNSTHLMYSYLIKSGLTSEELNWIEENSCPPDIIGINHYLLSNRFLDDELHHYPQEYHGGNKHYAYADVGAVDSGRAEMIPPIEIFREAWDRYNTAIAITEVHINGHRESQMRWFKEVWEAANELEREGVNIQAITAWSLLGSFDWNSLCTASQGYYESGVYDVRSPEPRPTALSYLVSALAKGSHFDHPVLEQKGWWWNRNNLTYASVPKKVPSKNLNHRPILITGSTGTLGRAFANICNRRSLPYVLVTRQLMDIADRNSVIKALDDLRPWAVINTAGYVKVDLAEAEPEKCLRENTIGAENLAIETANRGIRLVTYSTDYVFNGDVTSPYLESHETKPINLYGKSKADAEIKVLGANPQAMVIRTSSFFGPWDEYNFLTQTTRKLLIGQTVEVADNMTVSPTYVPDLANATLDLLIDSEYGIWHLVNEGQISWSELALIAADRVKADRSLIIGRNAHELKFQAPRPLYTAMRSERGNILSSLEGALSRYFDETKISI